LINCTSDVIESVHECVNWQHCMLTTVTDHTMLVSLPNHPVFATTPGLTGWLLFLSSYHSKQ